MTPERGIEHLVQGLPIRFATTGAPTRSQRRIMKHCKRLDAIPARLCGLQKRIVSGMTAGAVK